MPVPADDQVLVRVHASSVNPVEWYGVTGLSSRAPETGCATPTFTGVGADVAGTVEAIGNEVDGLAPGDEVYGVAAGAWAEFASRATGAARAEAGEPVLRAGRGRADRGGHGASGPARQGTGRAGQKVLINGASGGVGTFAVQLAKSFGAEVTGVCSTRNVELVRSLGADHVIDYTKEDFTRSARTVRPDPGHRRQPLLSSSGAC